MQTTFLKPRGIRTSYLNIDSKMDVAWESIAHNPANFTLSLPNSIRTNKIWKISPHTVVIPRMFPNIYSPDNQINWYQRQVVEIPTGNLNEYLRTVSPFWTVTKSLTLPTGQWNVESIVAAINTVSGANEVWSFDPTTQTFLVTKTPTDPAVVFGVFIDPAHVPPAVSYANMTYIAEPPDTHLFDALGLEKNASLLSTLPLSPSLLLTDPDTFDNLVGSNLAGRNAFPLFDRTLHSYSSWAVTPYSSLPSNMPNLAGPVVIHVALSDLGDSSTVDAESGVVQDIITSVNIGDVDFGTFKTREINDLDGEAIEYQQARNVSRFNVKLLDSRNRQLVLPRNFPIFLKLQMIHTTD
jgi:hypothetical protein